MNIAIYTCRDFDSLVELLGNLDPGESMEVLGLRHPRFSVTYKSANLSAVATDPCIDGVALVYQRRFD